MTNYILILFDSFIKIAGVLEVVNFLIHFLMTEL